MPPEPPPVTHGTALWGEHYQRPYKEQEVVSKAKSQGHSPHFLTQDPVFFFPKKDCLTGFLFPPVAL